MPPDVVGTSAGVETPVVLGMSATDVVGWTVPGSVVP